MMRVLKKNILTVAPRLRKIPHLLLLIIFGLYTFLPVMLTTQTASALSAEQKKLYKQGIHYFDYAIDVAECGGAGGASVEVQPGENKRAAFLYFIGRGLTANQSAGFVGNLEAESGVTPDINETNPVTPGSRGGYGIAQWTGGRRVAIEKFAADNGKDLKSLQFQLDYLWDQELMQGYKTRVLDPLIQTTSIKQASDIVLHKFETPLVIINNIPQQVRELENLRAAMGQKIFELYGAEAGSVTPANPGTSTMVGNAGASCAAGTGTGGVSVGFPLKSTKAKVAQMNSTVVKDAEKKFGRAGHPYAAYDIFADPGTPVMSIMDGVYNSSFSDKCGGMSVSVYNAAQGVTISYMHMGSITPAKGAAITPGQELGKVGSSAENACGTTPHVHVDTFPGEFRPGCTRESCPAASVANFEAADSKINMSGGLYDAYSKLP